MTPGEVVSVEIPPPRIDEILPDPIPLAIVYEDADVIVVDKPAGMVVHPAPGHPRGTLANALLAHVPGIAVGGSQRPGIVHRLDKDTSGLIVAAKTDRGRTCAGQPMGRVARLRRPISPWFRAQLEDEEAIIDAPIGRDPKNRQRMAVVRSGRPAVTHFHVVERFPDTTLLEVSIETGRTHQIRVHLAFIGHPIVGDQVYGRARPTEPRLDRQFLHASALGFRLPDGTALRLEAPLPEDLQAVLEELRAESASFVPNRLSQETRSSIWHGLGFASSSSPRSMRSSQRVRCATGSIGMTIACSSAGESLAGATGRSCRRRGQGGRRHDARRARGIAWKHRLRGRHHQGGPRRSSCSRHSLRVHEAGHPIPDERGVKATNLGNRRVEPARRRHRRVGPGFRGRIRLAGGAPGWSDACRPCADDRSAVACRSADRSIERRACSTEPSQGRWFACRCTEKRLGDAHLVRRPRQRPTRDRQRADGAWWQ